MSPGRAAAGLAAAALVAAGTLGPVAAVLGRAEGWPGFGPADWAALRFTLLQAVLSALLSVALAVPVARALARRRFPGRAALVTLLGAPFLLPVIVAVLGLITVFGQQGWLNRGLGALGLPGWRIYGLQGVLLAHVFLNLPLAARLILQGWQAIPAERFRLAASLGFGPRETFRHLEWPMLRAVVPGAFLVIFLVCLTSFAVALTMGGGPRATTVELAIYQAFRFDFDLARAAGLALVQLALCLGAAALAFRFVQPMALGAGLDAPVERWDAAGGWRRATDAAAILAAAAFLVVPMAAIVARGLPGLMELGPGTWAAAGRSLAVAAAAAALCVALSLALALPAAALRRGAGWIDALGLLPLSISPFVLGTGAFLLIRQVAPPTEAALPVTAVANGLLALPFALRVVLPAAERVEADYGRLAATLGLSGWRGLLRVRLPRMRRALGFSAGLAGAMSMGDLGIIALFAGSGGATLPYHMYGLMAAYRMEAAAGAALLLVALSLGVFWLLDRGGRMDAAA